MRTFIVGMQGQKAGLEAWLGLSRFSLLQKPPTPVCSLIPSPSLP